MANYFRVHVEGLDKFKEHLNSDKLSRGTIIGIAKGINEVHKTLQAEVFRVYGFRKQLASVRVGGNNRPRYLPGAKAIIEQELIYEGEPVPLQDFNHRSIFDVPARRGESKSFFHAEKGNIEGKIIPRRKPLERVLVSILREDGFKNPNKRNTKAFTLPSGEIVSRKKTDKGNPTQQLRSKTYTRTYRFLYGPSLPQAAELVFKESSAVQAEVDNISSLILNEIINL